MDLASERHIHPAVLAALLALVTILVFLPTLGCGFVDWDNVFTHPGLEPLKEGLSWRAIHWAFTDSSLFAHRVPLTAISHMVDWQLYGDRPAGHHLTSVVFHAATVVLLFAFWRASTGRDGEAAAASLLWGIHPLRVESVAWLAERKDVLSGFFGVLALVLYVHWVRRGSPMRYLAMTAAFALALLAKQIVITLPVLMLLLDVWPLGRLAELVGVSPVTGRVPEVATPWGLLREKLPLLSLSLVSGALAWRMQLRGHAMPQLQLLPMSTRLGNAAVSIRAYLSSTFWPVRLSALYPLHLEELNVASVVGAVALFAAITAACLVTVRRWPWLAMGWGWFLIALLPVSGILQAGPQARADRYTYWPHIGLILAIVWSVSRLGAALLLSRRSRWLAGTALLSGVAVLSAADARAQISHWRDTRALFTHMIEVDSRNEVGHLYLGRALLAQRQVGPAVAHLRRAVDLAPEDGRAHTNLGVALVAAGDREGAVREFARAIEADPTLTLPRRNLALLELSRGESVLAARELARVVLLDPGDPIATRALGTLLAGPEGPVVRPAVAALASTANGFGLVRLRQILAPSPSTPSVSPRR